MPFVQQQSASCVLQSCCRNYSTKDMSKIYSYCKKSVSTSILKVPSRAKCRHEKGTMINILSGMVRVRTTTMSLPLNTFSRKLFFPFCCYGVDIIFPLIFFLWKSNKHSSLVCRGFIVSHKSTIPIIFLHLRNRIFVLMCNSFSLPRL